MPFMFPEWEFSVLYNGYDVILYLNYTSEILNELYLELHCSVWSLITNSYSIIQSTLSEELKLIILPNV